MSPVKVVGGSGSAPRPTGGFTGGPTVVGSALVTSVSVKPAAVPGQVLLWAPEINLTIALRNRELPQVTKERAGGFTVTPVPELRPMISWDGHPEVELTIVGMIDKYPLDDVVDEIAALRRLGAKVSTEIRRPPIVRPVGRVPNPTTGDPDYVLNGLEIVEEEHVGGLVARAKCTVTLLQWTPADVEVSDADPDPSPPRRHKWVKSDTLASLAKKYLGDARKASAIRAANPKIEKFSEVKPGTTVLIPARGAAPSTVDSRASGLVAAIQAGRA